MTLDDAYRNEMTAKESLDRVRDEHMAERSNALKEWERTVGAEINARWKDRIDAAQQALSKALEETKKVQLEEGTKNAIYAPGTILVGWVREDVGRYTLGKWVAHFKGVAEIFNPDTVYQKTLKWSKPAIGALVVRIYRSDGTLGRTIAEVRYSGKEKWLPEGVKPKEDE